MLLTELVRVKVKSSIILDSPLPDCWRVCRAWGRQPWMPLLPDGTNFDVQVLHGSAETEVGAVRQAKFGGGSQIFEKLVALDDDQHIMKWQLVSHSNTVNPFQEASFVNFFTTLSLHSVTIGECTFAEWEGEFYTDPMYADSMRDTFESWYAGGMTSLKEYMARQQAKQRAGKPEAMPSAPSFGRQDPFADTTKAWIV